MGIAACINVFNDAAALRGLLEQCVYYFDNIFVIHASPNGSYSTDGTIELLAEFGIQPIFADMNDGYGLIRTRLIHECGEEWAFILDADERFFPALPIMRCLGDERYPEQPEPKLNVLHERSLIYQGQHVKHLIGLPHLDAIKTIRRHWFDFSMTRPSENWTTRFDWQLRIIRNRSEIGYRKDVKMHEQIIDSRINDVPVHYSADPYGGPFHDHFHLHFRRAFPGKKEANEANYDRLARGLPMT